MNRAVLHSEANREFLNSARRYEKEVVGLGGDFIDCVEECRNRILENPVIGRPESAGCRSLKTRRFPFRLFYLMESDRIWIVAVAHLSRRPEYWRDRVET